MEKRLGPGLLALLALIAVALACGPLPLGGTAAPAEAPPAAGADTASALEEPTPTLFMEPSAPTPEPAETMPPAATIAAPPGDEWLLIAASSSGGTLIDTLWLADAGGAGARPIVSGQQILLPWDWDPGAAISPDGRYLAAITTTDPIALTDLMLILIELPSGAVTPVTPLASPATATVPSDDPFGDDNWNIARTMTEVSSLAWSPDGTQLAFMGAISGTSSDLYIYDIPGGFINQISSEPSQGIRPSWSPDGRYVVFAGVSSLGTGAGYGMEGMWAAAADRSGVTELYTPEGGDEQLIGWLSPDTAVVYTWDAFCGTRSLRTLNVVSGAQEPLFDGYFNEVAFDASSGTALVTVPQFMAECSEGAEAGVYLVDTANRQTARMLDSDAYQPTWSETAQAYYVRTDIGAVQITVFGSADLLPAPAPVVPVISPRAGYWAWPSPSAASPGLWAGPFGEPPREITADAAAFALWTPSGDRLFYLSGDVLYAAAPPGFEPAQVAAGIAWSGRPPAWVSPPGP